MKRVCHGLRNGKVNHQHGLLGPLSGINLRRFGVAASYIDIVGHVITYLPGSRKGKEAYRTIQLRLTFSNVRGMLHGLLIIRKLNTV